MQNFQLKSLELLTEYKVCQQQLGSYLEALAAIIQQKDTHYVCTLFESSAKSLKRIIKSLSNLPVKLKDINIVTVKLPITPAVEGDGKPAIVSVVAVPEMTLIPVCMPVIELVTVSVAVSDWDPKLPKVAANCPAPALSLASGLRIALASLLVRWTVPA